MIIPLLLFILFVATTYYIVHPLLSPALSAESIVDDDSQEDIHLRDKINILQQIRELEFEREMGITIEEDYQRIRRELLQEAGRVLGPEKESAKPAGKKSKSKKGKKVCSSCGNSVSREDRFCATCGVSLAPACTQCGEPLIANARFCTQCGTPVTA